MTMTLKAPNCLFSTAPKTKGRVAKPGPLTDSQRELASTWARLPAAIAREFTTEPGMLSDLMSLGHVALCRAASVWSPDRRVKFPTFAGLCIRRDMIREVSRQVRQRSHEVQGIPVGEIEGLQVVERSDDAVLVALELSGRLSVLPEDLRRIVYLVCYQGYSLREVGEEMGYSGVSAWTKYHKALALLRNQVDEDTV